MSTIGYSNWNVDLAEVGAIYPFQGTESLMWLIGLALWIGWHIYQARAESTELDERASQFDKDSASKNIERY